MDLSTFQLVDAINDMDMLRNLSDQEQYPHRQQNSNTTTFVEGDIDLLFQPNQSNPLVYNKSTGSQVLPSPHFTSNREGDFNHQQEDIFTPLISPAMTPHFTYQMQQKMNTFTTNSEMDFSPLSSPAIMPQADRYQKRTVYQDSSAVGNNNDDYESMSANQICEQYEQLEQAKQLITRKLSELQKTQHQRNTMPSAAKNNPSSVQSLSDHIVIQHQDEVSRSSSPSRSPRMEPATPASLMNMKIANAKLQFSSSSATHAQQFYNGAKSSHNFSTPITGYGNNSSVANANHVFQSPILNSTHVHDGNPTSSLAMSPLMTPPVSSSSTSVPPPSPLSLHPRKPPARSSSLKEKPSRFSNKKQRRESSDTAKLKNIHASPRALKPLLISPTLNPGIKPAPVSIVSSSSNASVHSVEDAERILATRSNYQNLMEGKGAALGIAFDTQIKSGLEVRRTAHKAAEQKRRDSLKEWFDRLRREVEDGYVKRQKTLMSQVIKAQELEKNSSKHQQQRTTDDEDGEESAVDASNLKPLSKVLLLQYAYEYISSLKDTLQKRDATIERLQRGKVDDEAVAGSKRKNEDLSGTIAKKASVAEDNHDYDGQL